jgi:TM2 domain-containing membrane protein YozV
VIKEPNMSSIPPNVPPTPDPSPGTFVRLPKSSILAVFLSILFPGLGQIYVGQPAKAFLFFFAFVGSISATAGGAPFPFAFLIFFVWAYAAIDSYRGAETVNARFLGAGPERRDDVVESPWWGGGLVVLGLILLFNNLGWIHLEQFYRLWPLLLIAVGGAFLYASFRRRANGESRDSGA